MSNKWTKGKHCLIVFACNLAQISTILDMTWSSKITEDGLNSTEMTSLERKIDDLIFPKGVFNSEVCKYLKSALIHSNVPSSVKLLCIEKIAEVPKKVAFFLLIKKKHVA